MEWLASVFLFFPFFFATQKSQQRNRNTLTVSVSLCDLQQQKSGVLYPNPSSKSAILARSCVKRYFGSSLRRQLFWPKKRYLKDTYTLPILHRECGDVCTTSIQITLPGETIDFSRLLWYSPDRILIWLLALISKNNFLIYIEKFLENEMCLLNMIYNIKQWFDQFYTAI